MLPVRRAQILCCTLLLASGCDTPETRGSIAEIARNVQSEKGDAKGDDFAGDYEITKSFKSWDHCKRLESLGFKVDKSKDPTNFQEISCAQDDGNFQCDPKSFVPLKGSIKSDGHFSVAGTSLVHVSNTGDLDLAADQTTGTENVYNVIVLIIGWLTKNNSKGGTLDIQFTDPGTHKIVCDRGFDISIGPGRAIVGAKETSKVS